MDAESPPASLIRRLLHVANVPMSTNSAFAGSLGALISSIYWANEMRSQRSSSPPSSSPARDVLHGAAACVLASLASALSWDFFETASMVLAAERDLLAAQQEPHPPDYCPDLDVKLPIPDVSQLSLPDVRPGPFQAIRRYADPEYFLLSVAVFVGLFIFALWYFWPERRPDIAPPRSRPGVHRARPTKQRRHK